MRADKQKIDQQWQQAVPHWRPFKHNSYKGEHDLLYDVLQENENIEAIVGGMFSPELKSAGWSLRAGIIVATNHRVLFLDKGMLGNKEVADMPYASIETVAYSTGLFMAGIKITGRGTANYQIENVPKNEVQAFVDVVRTHLMAKNIAAQTTDNTSAHLVADEIEKLASLMERGFLTSQEFDAKKKQLLEI